MTSPVGSETLRLERLVVSVLAQPPETRSEILFQLRSAIQGLNPGSIVVATAANKSLAERYGCLGFTRSERRRMYLVV